MLNGDLASAVRKGLGASPKGLPPRFFYDDAGSRLYEQITTLHEYYPTRTEAAILSQHAPEILDAVGGFEHLLELGSGSAAKTRTLLAAMGSSHPSATYHPIDISRSAIDASVEAIRGEFPGLTVDGHVGEYHDVLAGLNRAVAGRRFVIFLGSSIGNFSHAESVEFLSDVRAFMKPGEALLLGTDLVKDPAVVEAAYNDSQGVTARFNLNILTRINRELEADFDLGGFRHRAFFNKERSRVEMHLESLRDQVIRVGSLDQSFSLSRGETIHTENSYKYSPSMLADMAEAAMFEVERSWMDSGRWFGVHLWRHR